MLLGNRKANKRRGYLNRTRKLRAARKREDEPWAKLEKCQIKGWWEAPVDQLCSEELKDGAGWAYYLPRLVMPHQPKVPAVCSPNST
ncbi:hypothetical protein NL676_023542 [Syzygium grande]|nr:hypothetical protein NL676_023542 [Syzygium grande]